MTTVDEIGSGDERRALIAMRDVLAQHLLTAESSVVAQVAARLQAVVKRLAELDDTTTEVSTSDEIARRREARRSAAKVVETPAAGGGKRRG